MAFDDALRVGMFLLFGVGAGFMVGTNVLAYRVLRPPKRLGFLWWHVTAISAAFTCISLVGMKRMLERLNQGGPIDRWAVLLGVGLALFAAAQIIIFNVERQRYANKVAATEASTVDRHRDEEP